MKNLIISTCYKTTEDLVRAMVHSAVETAKHMTKVDPEKYRRSSWLECQHAIAGIRTAVIYMLDDTPESDAIEDLLSKYIDSCIKRAYE